MKKERTNIINIEEGIKHVTSEVICLKCWERWYAIRPKKTLLKDLECSTCGKGYVIETGEYIPEVSHA